MMLRYELGNLSPNPSDLETVFSALSSLSFFNYFYYFL